MIRQDQTKYGIMKSRLVVRFTNAKVIAQVIKAHIDGDRTIFYADSSELKQFGINFGLTNFSAAYATGLLIASRAKETECCLDIGLKRSSTGANVFAVLKGAIDGGMEIPFSTKRFYGYDKESKKLDSNKLKDRIFGKILGDYMISVRTNDPEQYKKLFSDYVRKGIQPENLGSIYETAFDKIRNGEGVKSGEKSEKDASEHSAFSRARKLTAEERKLRAENKLRDLSASN